MRVNHIISAAAITYANGAVVKTSFVTSFGGDCVAQTAPSLTRAIDEAMAETIKEEKAKKTTIPKYEYPMHVVTAAMINRYDRHGVDYKVRRGDCAVIAKLDAQQAKGKAIFGGGLLLNDRAAAERAAAEKATAIKWELSDREREIIRQLGK